MLLSLDRLLGMHFFTSGFGGNPMMYVNLIWMWGHPEVYILVIPAFGIFSEIVATFSQKRIFGYVSMVCAILSITALSFLVWLHHFFTMGAGADVNAFFGILTDAHCDSNGCADVQLDLHDVPGADPFHLAHVLVYGIREHVHVRRHGWGPLASPAADFQLHNTLFLVAHFHTMIVGGALFGIFAGITYWFPKVTGFILNEKWGKRAFWLWLVGFFTLFTPLYILGFMGATRRIDHYDISTGLQPLFIVAAIGVVIIALGALVQVWQIIVSVKERKQNIDTTGDPWNGRTLEWATPSPVPFYSFAVIPEVHSRDAFWEMKKEGKAAAPVKYEDITLAKNTGMPIYLSGFIFLFGFAMVWHLIWLAVLGIVGAIACVIMRSFDEDTEYILPAAEVARMEMARIHS